MANHPFNLPVKLLCHTEALNQYRTTGDTYPIFMEVNLTSKCNLGCKWCISGNFQRNSSLNETAFANFVLSFSEHGGKALTFSGGGEPTLHPDFQVMTSIAKLWNIDLGLITNGTWKPELRSVIDNKFKWVRVSLDTVDHEEYKQWKGVDILDQVLVNIKFHKGPSKLALNVNIGQQHTIQTVENLITSLKDTVDIIQFRPILPRQYCREKTKLNDRVWDYLEDNWMGDPKITFSLDKFNDLKTADWPFRKCRGHHFAPILDSNGNVCVCMYHPDDDRFVFGNIYNQSLEEIWNSSKRKQVIEFIEKLDYSKECQLCCKLTELNKIIDTIHNPTADVNFF